MLHNNANQYEHTFELKKNFLFLENNPKNGIA